MTPMEVGFGSFRPDLSDYSPQFSDAILNVEPKPDGYGPLPAFVTFGAGLGERCLGAISVRKNDGSSAIYAGISDGLYLFDGTNAFDNVTRGISTTEDPYATGVDKYWSFAPFGALLVACNGTDETQFINVNSGTEFADLSNAPVAQHVEVIKDFLVFAGISGNPNAVQWSGVNNATNYTTGGSDIQTFPDGGPVQGIVGHEGGGIVLQRDKIRVMEFSPDDFVFRFRVIHENIGCFAPRSIVKARNTFFWYDQGGFFEGMQANPIGDDRVNNWITRVFTGTELRRLRGAHDPVRKMVWWSGTRANGDIHMVGYDYVLGEWTQADAQADIVFSAITPGFTIDTISNVFSTMDSITIPWDSSFWEGSGALTMAGFNADGDFGYFNGNPMDATLETVDIEMAKGGEAFLQSARLVSDAPYSAVTGQVGTRPHQGAAITWTTEKTPSSETGRMWFRRRARTHRIRCEIASTDWHNANGVMVYANASGGR